jgi:hypothetical protein
MARKRWRPWLALAGVVALVGTAGTGCGQKKRTEIIVGLATDLTAPTPLRSVQMQVFRLPQMVPIGEQEFMISGDINEVYELPGTYAVYSEKGEADRVRVVLTATDDKGAVLVVRKAILTLVPERTLFVRLGVVSACRGRDDCPAGDSCVEGRCAPEEIESSRLPNYRSGMEAAMECASGTMFANTSTKKLLEISGSSGGGASCDKGTCQEGTCLAPTGGAFSSTDGALSQSRSASYQVGRDLMTLDDGSVLLVGGLGPNATPVLAASESYDPKTSRFSLRGDLGTARTYFGAAKLHDGRVLIVGGINESATALATAEIYDPKAGTFTPTPSPMTEGRVFPAAVTLADGRVLIAGGMNQIQSYQLGTVSYFGALATAEIFNPTTGMFTPTTGRLNEGRAIPNIAALSDGGALVSCGFVQGTPVRTIERFNATTGMFGAPPLLTVPGATGACATAPVADGRLLVYGDAGTWVLDATTGIFRGTGPEPQPPGEFVTVMTGGDVLFAGGDGGTRAYIFQLSTRSFVPVTGELHTARTGLAGALLPNGDVLIAGGDEQGTAELFHRPTPKPATAGN